MENPEEDTTYDDYMHQQKTKVWTMIALNSADQLRQRMAWALSQIVTVVEGNIDAYDLTEIYRKSLLSISHKLQHLFGSFYAMNDAQLFFLASTPPLLPFYFFPPGTSVNYYDIMVRNAFGNYRDVLKEDSSRQHKHSARSLLRSVSP